MSTWKLTIGIEKGVSVINLYYDKRRLRYWNGKAIGLKLLSREKPELLKAAFELKLIEGWRPAIKINHRLDLQKLVKPNAKLPVGIESNLLCAEAMRLRDTVDDHEVVAEAVHLCEGKSHLLFIGRLLHRCRDCSQSPTARATQERAEVLPFPVREQFERPRHRP